ncbi:DUF6049 family protein [Wenjunlia tyrosinilytica]|uniref:Uncharacterized protein n=1 Tax=Wenjunlia tyrosinilytica TaxID=1544741 RepID=A0A918DVL8_9ACTN|nr:DUF6049 family protein [Wenjunlia tyrosinilytica]GGO86247.1 hypothetical protein GCM10012280_21910 [Wenjunlia tyrosinilytica]
MGKAARHFGTTPARVRLLRAGALLAGGLLLAGTAYPAQAAAPRRNAAGTAAAKSPAAAPLRTASPAKAPSQPGTGSETAAISLTSITPTVPGDHDTVTVSGTVTNNGRSTITGAHVGLRLGQGGQALGSRSDLSATAGRKGLQASDGSEITGHTQRMAAMAPGISRPFTLKVPVEDLNLGGNGVYQLGVSLYGQDRAAPYGHVLGIERTFLPWYPDPADTQHTRVALAWPLVDRPHLDARTDSDPQQTPVFRDDRLAAELAPGGRLEQMVSIGKNLPVTWVIDPDLLATVDAMAKGYKVADDGETIDKARPGSGSQVAKRWLNELKTTVKSQKVVALPFADPDLASIAHHGRFVPGTLGHLKSATDLAAETTDTILGVRPRTDVAWPFEGAVDRSIVSVARTAGADKVVVGSSALGAGGLNRTPNSPRPIGGGTTALVSDSTLSNTFNGDMAMAGKSTQAVQRFLAETLMITMEAPNTERSVLVTPPRGLAPSAAQSLSTALSAAQDGKWMTPVSLETLEKASPDREAQHAVPGSSRYPAQLRKGELGTNAFREIQNTQASLKTLLSILSQQRRVITPFNTAVLRSMSNSWRGDASGAGTYRSSVAGYLKGLQGAVHVMDKSDVTLSGSSGTVQVTVENNLAQEVRNLHLELTSGQRQRFQVGDPQVVSVAGAHRKSFKFHTSAKANGPVPVVAQLYTENGEPYGKPMTFEVNVKSVTEIVLVVIAFGLLLLVLAGARMYRQRKRSALAQETSETSEALETSEAEDGAEREDDAEADDGAGEEDPSGDDPHTGTKSAGQEAVGADPKPDTCAEGSEPDVSDEKVDR